MPMFHGVDHKITLAQFFVTWMVYVRNTCC